MENKKLLLLKLLRKKRIYQCRNSFWEFCKEFSPVLNDGTKLYNEDTKYLKDLANDLQDLIENKLILENGEIALGINISMPPRHGKSYTVNMFVRWYLGNYANKRIFSLSYSQNIANQFSRSIRNDIKDKINGKHTKITYNDVFPHLDIATDQKSAEKWALKDTTHEFTFATASFRTAITGLGFDLGIVDDPVKNSEEALNDDEMEKKWTLFIDTFISRVEKGGKWIVIQTRWSRNDIIGKLRDEPVWGPLFKNIELKVKDDEDNFLNDSIFGKEEYVKAKSIISDHIFEANYNQQILDLKFTLYNNIKKWKELPMKTYKRVAVLDPSADGSDYMVCVVGNYYKDENKIYLTDIFYDNREFNILEDELIDFIIKNDIEELIIESNGAFQILYSVLSKKLNALNCKTKLIKFNQSENKEARILAYSNAVQAEIFWMPDCEYNYSEAFNHFKKFKSKIKDNSHDDIEDAITLLWEKYLNIYKRGNATATATKFSI